MDVFAMSDAELLQLGEPIFAGLVKASNSKDWELFSSYLRGKDMTEELRKDVEEQWDKVPFLTSLSDNREYLCALHRGNAVHLLWKQACHSDDIERLGVLILENEDTKVQATGFFFK